MITAVGFLRLIAASISAHLLTIAQVAEAASPRYCRHNAPSLFASTISCFTAWRQGVGRIRDRKKGINVVMHLSMLLPRVEMFALNPAELEHPTAKGAFDRFLTFGRKSQVHHAP